MADKPQATDNQPVEQSPAFTVPDEVTEPCLAFLLATGQVMGLIQAFARLAFAQENLLRFLANDQFFVHALRDSYKDYLQKSGIAEDDSETINITAFLEALIDAGPKAEIVVGQYAPLLNQMLLTRAVDNFLLYLAELLLLMYRTKLGATQVQGTDIEEFIGLMTEQYVERTSMGGMQKLARDFKDTFGVKLFPSQRTVTDGQIERTIARRNIIVHNRGIASRYYLRKVPTPGLMVGQPIPFTWEDVRADVIVLMRAVLDIDERLSTQFKLPRVAVPSPQVASGAAGTEQVAPAAPSSGAR